MFGRESKSQIKRDRDALQARLDEMEPYAAEAEAIVNEVAKRLATSPGQSTDQIIEAAKAAVLESSYDEAKAYALNEYITDHVDELFDNAVNTIQANEGQQLLDTARQVVETDPQLKAAMADRAFLAAHDEAMMEVAHDFAESIQAIVELEKVRQLELNKFRVSLHQTTELNLQNTELARVLKHGDKMRLLYESSDGKERYIEFSWYEESDDDTRGGWLYKKSSDYLYVPDQGASDRKAVRVIEISEDYFTTVNCLGHNRTTGQETYLWNTLKLGLPITLSQDQERGANYYRLLISSQRSEYIKPLLTGCEFITRPIKPEIS